MLSDTLADGLAAYRIGPKIRELRQKKGLGLVQLGEHTGLSSGMLSKIERGQLFPTLPTLLRIALVFGVGLDHFFIEEETKTVVAIVRKADRLRLPDRPGNGDPSYVFESLDFPVADRKLETYFAAFEAAAPATEPHAHPGAEVIYVIEGQLIVNIDGRDAVLGEGDSIYFDSGAPHSYRRGGDGICTAVVAVAR